MYQKQIVDQVAAEVQQRLVDQQAGHGFDHICRVLHHARKICDHEGGDRFIIDLAALLHDVGDAKFNDGVECSGPISQEILGGLSVDPETISRVVHIVDNLSFRKRQSAQPLSLEGQVVQDADRLDALGAIGIVRTIEYGAALGQPFYDPDKPDAKTGVAHFYEKLFKLRELMNTETARQLADQREQFMRTFLDQFLTEWAHSKPGSISDCAGQ